MRIHISSTDGVPIYMQIVQQVRRLVAGGELNPGDELPSIRALADQLLVNPNTVARAYRDLEVAGVVTSSRGLGTYVAETDSQMAHDEKRAVLIERVDALLIESRQLQIPLDEVFEILKTRDTEIFASKNGETEVKNG